MNELSIILAKRTKCGYCIKFKPIFDELKTRNNIIDNYNVTFHEYDFGEKAEELDFSQTHGREVMNKIRGVPTLFIKRGDNYDEINIDFLDESVSEATDKLINNIRDFLNNKKKGGSLVNELEEEYRIKYLKYKNKYLSLKNKN